MTKENKTRLYAFGTILFWSSAFVFTKIALQHFTAPSLGILRYLVASLFFLVLAVKQRIGLPQLKDIPKFFVSGALGFSIYMPLFNQASRSLSPATGSILIATAPIITALLANIVLREKIRLVGWIAIVTEFAGILILTLWEGVLSVNSAIFIMLAAALCVSGYNLFQRYYAQKYTALQATTYNVFAGTIMLMIYLPGAASQLSTASVKQWIVIAFMGIFPSAIAYLWWGKALSLANKTSDVTNFMFITPLLATLMGFFVIREAPNAGTVIGGGIILLGLLLFQKSNAKTQGTECCDFDVSEKEEVPIS